MGCDGGSIPRRDEMVKLKKKAEKAEKDIELAAKWRHCAISAEKLAQPIVACELGRLYNKEAVLVALLDKSNMPEVVAHIRSLKDVFELCLTPNPSYKTCERHTDIQSSEYICPVTGLEMSGYHHFSFLRSCGCAISEKALKEVPSETCHKCGKGFTKDDVVIINGSDEDVKKLAEMMEERRKQAKLNKRKRKAITQQVEQDTPTISEAAASSSSSGHQPNDIIETSDPSTLPKLPDPVVVSAKSADKRPKLTAGSSSSKTSETGSNKALKSKDVKSRDAYRSLFTSTTPARPKELTSNWVTFFPYY